MICGTCRHDNQPNAKFCSECGTPLARRCPACDTEQAPAAKFCDECGTPLTATPPPAPASASSPSASRKRVTALFADLVGSTSFAERVDPEAVRSSLAPYFALLQATIDDHAGSVVKFLGDGVLALFGVPEVAEDDALRAVAAGVELQRRFRSFADEIRERHGAELGLRVGINTGELVIGGDDVDLVGDVLNTAARLEAACEPGRVLVGEDSWRLTRSNVAYEVLDEVRVKGKADAVATFQVVEHDDGAGGPSDDVTVFVGRSDELDVLGGVFADAVATSSARLATVIGSPGVGKTRLARELCARTETRSFDLRLERRGATTFTPIADLLRAAAGSASIEAIDGFLEDHPEQDRLAPVLASFLGHGDARTTEESFWAVRRLLELLAADGPVIVVVDDIQWAEPLFWDLLDHLVEWTAAPVLLLALARPELRDLRPELTQPGRRVAASIALEGLDADTTLELAARLLGIDELPAELADRLPESTEGNPLFVRELVQMLVDDGVLARDGDRWRLTIDADAIEVPPTILSLLASRVERLPDDERQVVELASVIGTEFDRGTLEAIADADVAGRLGVVIDRLRRKDLIEPSGQWSGDHPVYRFHHVLIRDAAYRRLLKAHRAELHELVGRHVESPRVADDEVDIIVAHHFEQVFRYRSELGALDDHTRTLATTAATHLRSAAELALEREDLSSAGNAAIRALQLLDIDAGADRDELLLIGCEALLSTADATKAAPLVDELHERSSDERLAAWADCFRGQMWSLTDAERLTEAAEVSADAAERLAAIGDDSGVAKARLVRASCLARLGRVGDCEAELDLALGAARAAGDRRRTVAVLGAAPLAALWGPSPVARAGGRCLDVLRLLRITSASPTVEATSIRCQGMLEALRGRFDSARSKLETSRATARELGSAARPVRDRAVRRPRRAVRRRRGCCRAAPAGRPRRAGTTRHRRRRRPGIRPARPFAAAPGPSRRGRRTRHRRARHRRPEPADGDHRRSGARRSPRLAGSPRRRPETGRRRNLSRVAHRRDPRPRPHAAHRRTDRWVSGRLGDVAPTRSTSGRTPRRQGRRRCHRSIETARGHPRPGAVLRRDKDR
jgi:class 3 adenylate cyclase